MKKGKSDSKSKDHGNFLWRGGKKIDIEKEDDRFTVIPSDSTQLDKVRKAPGVREVIPVTNQVFKVMTTSNERDPVMSALRSDAFRVIAHHAYKPKNTEGTIYYITDKIIVGFRSGTSDQQIDKLFERYKLKLIKEYDEQGKVYLVQVTLDSGENPVKIANRLAEEKIVSFAEPNMVNRFNPMFIPNDTLFERQWHLKSKNAPQLVEKASVDAPAAWDVTRGKRDIVIGIIDDGFDLSHPDFNGNGKIVSPKDYVDGDSNPFPTASHGDYHGTPCAGVALAESNGQGVVGVANGCAFMPVRFPLDADDDLMIEIFTEVSSKADVISCSWGPPPVFSPLPTAIYTMLKNIATTGGPRQKGCVICFAAGNYDAPINDPVNQNGVDWLDFSNSTIRKTTGPILSGFAAHPNVIAVAASTSLNRHAAYSNWGKEISVCAPSNNFHPLDPQEFVPGLGIWTTDNESFGEGFTAHSRFTGQFGGTSSATPLVAGIAGIVLSANPDLSASQVKKILQGTADKIEDTINDPILNENHGNYDNEGHSDWFGYGKVNAAKAVQKAVQLH